MDPKAPVKFGDQYKDEVMFPNHARPGSQQRHDVSYLVGFTKPATNARTQASGAWLLKI
jgi:hypothetical protein